MTGGRVSYMKVSCIICAHNEEKRISAVLGALGDHPLLLEVIVVDDGSEDGTAAVVRQWTKKYPNITLISLPQNLGKSSALATGLESARGDLILLLDADLKGLTAENVTELIAPVAEGSADISISLRKNSLPVYKMLGLDFVSGERVFKKSFIAPHIDTLRNLPGFSLEVFINELLIKENLRVKTVKWNNVVNPRKSAKSGLVKGTMDDASMISDILKVISAQDIIRQNYRILSLSVE